MSLYSNSQAEALKKLHIQWWIYTAILAGILVLGFLFLHARWNPIYALIWTLVSVAALGYQLWVLWKGLPENRRKEETTLLGYLGAGNIASLVRGGLIGLLYGFLFLPRPSGWLAWVPGVLYTTAVLIDFLDGYLARITNQVTRLGEILDMHLDGLGALAAAWLIVQYHQVPAWYILIGLARYLFLAGMWIRRRLGKPLYDLPPSTRRRGLAGLQMGFIFVMLWPLFSPPATLIAALGFGLPFLVSFYWDWLLVAGRLQVDAGQRYPRIRSFVEDWLPVGVRLGIFILAASRVIAFLPLSSNRGNEWLVIGLTVAIFLVLGFAGRGVSILGLAVLGFQQMTSTLSVQDYFLVFLYITILHLGSGKYSLWRPEEWLLHNKAGEKPLQKSQQPA